MQGILLTGRIRRTASDANVSRNDITLPVMCVVNNERKTGKIQRVDDGRTQDDFSIASTGELPADSANVKSGPGLVENLPSGNEEKTSKKTTECEENLLVNKPTQQGDAAQTANGKHDEQTSILTRDQSANASPKAAVVPKIGRASKVKVSSASDLPPEPEEGNIEYKRTLASASKSRFEHLVTQLKWRLEEGNGTAVYKIGVEDDGRQTGLNDHDLEWSLDTLSRMARCLGASCRVLRQHEVPNGSSQPTVSRMRFGRRRQRGQQDGELAFPSANGAKWTDQSSVNVNVNTGGNGYHEQSIESLGGNPTATNSTLTTERRRVAQVEIRQIAPGLALGETRVALLGDADAGKSTLIAVLAHGELDNGRGRSRLHLFRHRHEIESGRSSSASLEIVGVSDALETVSYATAYSVAALFEASRFVLAFVDLAGHPRFVRTTLSGLTAYAPQVTLLVVPACGPLSPVTRDHFQVARALGLPVVIIVNKIDLCRNGRSQLFEQVETELLQYDVGQTDKRDTPSLLVVDSLVKVPEALDIVTSRQSPIVAFAVSCVSGENLDLLQTFLNGLPERFGSGNVQCDTTLAEPSNGLRSTALSRSGEFLVDGVLTISQLGKVLCGTVVRGTLNEGDAVLIGPDTKGRFRERTIASIQRFGLSCSLVTAGQTASLHLGRLDEFEPRKGHVVLRNMIDYACEHVALKFQARVRPFDQSSKLREKMEVTIHCRNVTQTCTVVHVHVDDTENALIVTSSNSTSGFEQVVDFSFLKHPEYLHVGSPIVFRGSRARGVGHVLCLFPTENEAPSELGFKRISSTKTGAKSSSLSESCSCTENLSRTASPAPSLARPAATNTTIKNSTYSTSRTTQSGSKLPRTRCRIADSQTHERSLTESHCHA